MNEYLTILKHDLHKVKLAGATPHSEALPDFLMNKADGIAARFSRNWMKCQIEEVSPFRCSYFTFDPVIKLKSKKFEVSQIINNLFKEKDPLILHAQVLKSELLNMYSESLEFPFTSLKFHILLACAFYYNFTKGHDWFQLYLNENPDSCSEFQIIYKDKSREWALVPGTGMSRVQPEFNLTWDQRTKLSIGGENTELGIILSHIGSWSTALALVEEFGNDN